jgi:DNA-binding GntR family transcriptional regulator
MSMTKQSSGSPTGKARKGNSYVDIVLTKTRERILNGEYEPGTRLRIQQLASETGVSLIPVREALRILEAERLVKTEPNKGATVAELSVDDMMDLYETRILAEMAAIRRATPLKPEDAVALRRILSDMKAAFDADDQENFLALHRQFHFGIYQQCTSAWLSYIVRMLWDHTERYQRLSVRFRSDGAQAEHQHLLNLLEGHDNEAAAIAQKAHLESTFRLLADAYRANESPDPRLRAR